MKVLLLIVLQLLVLCCRVMSQSTSVLSPVPTPTPTSTTSPFSHPLDCPFADTSRCDPLCPYINFECEPGPGLITSTRTFSQSDICTPLFDVEFTGRCSFIMNDDGATLAFKCPNGYGLQTSLLCFPPNIPPTADYCFCNNSAYPRYRVLGVSDVRFVGTASSVTEEEETVTVCAVSGQLAEESIPVTVSISTASNTAQDDVDFVSLTREISFSQSNQLRCVDISILMDGVQELNESFSVELTLRYAPFDIPLDMYTVTIVDSDIVGVGFEQDVYVGIIPETVGNARVCIVINTTLSAIRTASAIVRTEDGSAIAGLDYFPVHEAFVFRINGDNRACVDIPIIKDLVRGEQYEVFFVRVTSNDVAVFADQAVIVILDQDQFYPFGREAGDEELTPGIVSTPETSSPPLTLTPSFRFFSTDEDTIYVNTNGALSFNQPFHVQFPQMFPFNSLALISPYWENFETQRFGRVYYRNTTDLALLRRAQYHLQDIFPSARNFFPSYLFLATWDNVPEFGIAGDPNLANTFQVVMATDGEKSFVFFIYFDIQWGEGTVGFNAGDGVKSFTLNGSLTTATRTIERGSNVDVEGLYAYRVDLPEIVSPGECGGQDDVIRLFNGSSALEGVVQYCFNSTWTPVCGDNWGESEAAVACRQLGLAGGDSVLREDFGILAPLTTDFNCMGTEGNLIQCTGSGAPPSFNSCQNVAGVICRAVQIGFEQDSYAISEMDESVTLCVNMTAGSSTVTVSIETIDIGSAQAGVDYDATTAEFMFEGAPQQACVQINITSDDLEEQNESFLVLLNTTLTSQTVSLNPWFAFVTIIDESTSTVLPTSTSPPQTESTSTVLPTSTSPSETAVQIGFKQDSYTISEMDESVTLCVNMTTGSSTVTVSIETIDIGSAQAGVDYDATTAEFMFEGAPQQACFQINITSDDLEEQNESFLVLLTTTLTSQTVSLNPRFAFVTITDESTSTVLPTSTSPSETVPVGAIAGGVVAAIVVLIVLIAGVILIIVICSWKWRQLTTKGNESD